MGQTASNTVIKFSGFTDFVSFKEKNHADTYTLTLIHVTSCTYGVPLIDHWPAITLHWVGISVVLLVYYSYEVITESPNIAKSEQSCIRDINFASFYDFPVWILQLSDSVVIFVFLFNFYLKYLFVLLCDIDGDLVNIRHGSSNSFIKLYHHCLSWIFA